MKRADRRTIRQSAYTIDVEFNGENVSPAISHDKRAEMGSSAFSAEKTDEIGFAKQFICRVPLQTRNEGNPPNPCARCLMPKQPVEFPIPCITHHRVARWSDEPYPEFGYGKRVPEEPDLIHLNAIPGRRRHLSRL